MQGNFLPKNRLKNCGWLFLTAALNITFCGFWKKTDVKCWCCPLLLPVKKLCALKPDGVLLSNGPGDPAALPYIVDTARAVIGKVPVFGICLGHQIIGQAIGGYTEKLKFGHHGINQPVKNIDTGRVEITSQNHGFVVVPESVDKKSEKNLS